MPGTNKEELQAELGDIRELTENASSVDELRQLVKSATAVASKALKDLRPKGDDDDDDVDADGDGRDQDEDDDTDGIDSDGDGSDDDDDDGLYGAADDDHDHYGSDAKPAGRRMNKSLSDAVAEALPESPGGVDAAPILEAVSEGLHENNIQNLQNFKFLKSISDSLRTLTTTVVERLDAIDDELAVQRPMVKSAAQFVEGIRRAPAGTPSSSEGVKAPQGGIMSKSLDGADVVAPVATTLRGLTQNQLINGLHSRLSKSAADHRGLSEEDLMKIGDVEMNKLNPVIAEVAAEELGLQLSDD